jgi:undecaprenyl-diphosphatase
MIVLTVVGSGWSMLWLSPLLIMKRTRAVAGTLGLALVLTAILVFSLKALVGRTRPWIALGVHPHYFSGPTDGSFPSGHAAGGFCVAAYCIVLVYGSNWSLHTRVAVSTLLAMVATGIAVSRVYLGVHYPLDIMAGAILGATIGAAFALRARAGSIQTPSLG